MLFSNGTAQKLHKWCDAGFYIFVTHLEFHAIWPKNRLIHSLTHNSALRSSSTFVMPRNILILSNSYYVAELCNLSHKRMFQMTKHYQIIDCCFAPTCVGAFSNEERKVPFSKVKGELCELIAFTGTIFLGFSTSQKSSCLFMSLHFFWAIPSHTVNYKSLDLQLIQKRLIHQ